MPPPLTVIVPVFNERATVDALLRRVVHGPYAEKQIVVVDDASTDGTAAVLRAWVRYPNLTVLTHAHNRGKGAAVRTGLQHARGEVTLIQDADLEYDPADYPRVVEPILGGEELAVYGSRYLTGRTGRWSLHRLGVAIINCLVSVLYGRRLTDEATCYKAAPTWLWHALELEAERFELCAEVTAKLCRAGVRIREVPVRYAARSLAEGKKIGWRDVWPTVWTLMKWRFRPMHFGQCVSAATTEIDRPLPACRQVSEVAG